MAKKSEINKKGRLAKSTLSVVLAASMVLTSSSFVWASPNEGDIAIIGEEDIEVVGSVNMESEPATEVQVLDESENVGATNTYEASLKANQTFTYSGIAIEPELEFKKGEETVKLEQGKDYTLSYADNDNVNAGEKTVIITYTDANEAIDRVPFTIQKASLTGAEVTMDVPEEGLVYNGTQQLPTITVKMRLKGATAPMETLVEGKDYKVEKATGCDFIKANGVDKQKFTIVAIENAADCNFKDAVGKTDDVEATEFAYTIKKAPFNDKTVTVTTESVALNSAGSPAVVSVRDKVTNEKLAYISTNANDSDYKLQYADEKGEFKDDNPAPKTTGEKAVRIVYTGKKNTNFTEGDYIDTTYNVVKDNTLSMLAKNATLSYSTPTADDTDATTKFSPANSLYDTQYVTYKGEAAGYKVNKVAITGLTEGTDFTAEYPAATDVVNVGDFEIKLTGKAGGSYEGETAVVPFKVVPMALNTASTGQIDENGAVTTNKADGITIQATLGTTRDGVKADNATVSIKRTIDGVEKNLVPGTDFTYTTNKVSKTVCITGKGNYTTISGEADTVKTFTVQYKEIDKMDLNDSSITATVNGTYSVTGSQIKPDDANIVVTDGSYPLKKGTDFEILAYGANDKAGTGTVEIQGKGRYTGTRTLTFTISGKATSEKYEFKKLEDFTYTGKAIKPALDANGKLKLTMVYKSNGTAVDLATVNKNFDIKYYRDGKETTDFISTGTITIEATAKAGTSAYEGKITTTYNIVGIVIGQVANVSAIADQVYTGSTITPDVKLTSKTGSVIFTKDKDYKVTYSNNKDAGTATVVVEGIGCYSGHIIANFKITGTDIKDAVVTVNGSYAYTGKEIIPDVTVKLGDVTLSAEDYTVTAANNKNAGTATVSVTGKGNCTGTTKETTFTIAKADQKLAVSKAITDALKIRNTNANTYTLKVTGAGTKLSYKSSDTKIASVNAAGKISFKHVCGKATIIVTAAADDNHNAATLKVAVAVKPATPKITISARAKGFNAKATAVKDITGYQVGYSTDKNFAAAKTTKKLVKTTKALNKNFSGLSAKKGYYVRVRAYKKVGTTVYWGNWTSAKKITTK